MTELVERLRAPCSCCDQCKQCERDKDEAADELDSSRRFREEQAVTIQDIQAARLDEQAELERLRAAINTLLDNNTQRKAFWDHFDSEPRGAKHANHAGTHRWKRVFRGAQPGRLITKARRLT